MCAKHTSLRVDTRSLEVRVCIVFLCVEEVLSIAEAAAASSVEPDSHFFYHFVVHLGRASSVDPGDGRRLGCLSTRGGLHPDWVI